MNREFIDDMNPVLKIIMLIMITIIGSVDFKPFLAVVMIVSLLIITQLFSTVKAIDVIKSIKGFLIISIGFTIVIALSRLLSGENLELVYIVGLSLRIILISSYTAVFVKTTEPTEFVLALIKYFKMPVRMGYAFLVAYRFLPTFKDELELIKYAHQVRGVEESKNPLIRVWQCQRYIIPMMTNAIRKSIRISMAMETRAFEKYSTRTYYRELSVSKSEVLMTGIFIIYTSLVTYVMLINNLVSIGLVFD